MTRSMAWSLLALGLAALNFVMHRDISSNVFFATFIFIQALKRPSDEERLVYSRMLEFASCAGAAGAIRLSMIIGLALIESLVIYALLIAFFVYQL